jgi:ferredoxin
MGKLVHLDDGRCCGSGNCAQVCPEMFEVVAATNKGRALHVEVPDDLRAAVERAAVECPTQAIELARG